LFTNSAFCCGATVEQYFDITVVAKSLGPTQLNRELRTQVSYTSKSASLLYTIINKQYHFITSSDRFPVPVRSAVKSNFTDWCCQNLSKRALNSLTVQASTIELGKLFHTMRAEKNAFVSHNEMNDFEIYSGCLLFSLKIRSGATVVSYMLWVILETSIISPRKRLHFSDHHAEIGIFTTELTKPTNCIRNKIDCIFVITFYLPVK